ncbi:hypothetical protein MKX03_021781 [Papaver bracteatum]|nr:hypothetical protein MKX03_021781 [Papaver bracteatum]
MGCNIRQHKIIGYIVYCELRCFTSCCIWAYPPLKAAKGYILYCHPKIQKTPKSDKLRSGIWLSLEKPQRRTLWPSSQCKTKVTASRVPYFNSDYWIGAAEDMINQLPQEEDRANLLKKGKRKRKTSTKRTDRLLLKLIFLQMLQKNAVFSKS